MANEVASLQKTKVAEVSKAFVPGKGSSSTMPQKRNSILCEMVIGLARLMTQPVATMLAAMMPEHERAMGEWHIEWAAIPQTCCFTAAALHHSLAIFDGLTVSAEAMQKNLALTQGHIVAEAVQMRLATHIGRHRAHDLMYEACLIADQNGQSLRSVLLEMPEVRSILSDHVLKLVEYVVSRGAKIDTATRNAGSAHLAFVVDGIFAAYESLRRQGVRFRSEPVAIEAGANRGGYTVYFLDPDDITLEIVQPPPHLLAAYRSAGAAARRWSPSPIGDRSH